MKRPEIIKFCNNCRKKVKLIRKRDKARCYEYDEYGNSYESEEEFTYYECSECGQYIHVYPCYNHQSEKGSCVECRLEYETIHQEDYTNEIPQT